MAKVKMPQVHSAANLFNMIGGEEWSAFKADIKAHGVLEPVTYVMRDGEKVYIDGRNRMKAVLELREEGHEVPDWKEEEFSGSEMDVLQHVLSKNLHGRRHLTSSQKAAIAAKAGGMYEKIHLQAGGEAIGDIATFIANLIGTNRQYVYQCRRIYKARPGLLNRIISGELRIPAALKEWNEDVKAKDQKDKEEANDAVLDGEGNPADPAFYEQMAARQSFSEAVELCRSLRHVVSSIARGKGADFLAEKEVVAFVESAEAMIAAATPHAVCPACDGEKKVQDPNGGRRKVRCARCNGNGYVNAARFAGTTTAEAESSAPESNGEAGGDGQGDTADATADSVASEE